MGGKRKGRKQQMEKKRKKTNNFCAKLKKVFLSSEKGGEIPILRSSKNARYAPREVRRRRRKHKSQMSFSV